MNLTAVVETSHRDVIHDAEMNLTGTRMATCSSDKMVKVFDVKGNGQHHHLADLVGHDMQVWGVAWSYPYENYGELLASCGMDKKVYIWKEQGGKFIRAYEYNQHEASINCVRWASHKYGIMFACASTDSNLSIVTRTADVWTPLKIFNAHDNGCNSVSWCPAEKTKTLFRSDDTLNPRRICSGGNDKLVKVWKETAPGHWELEAELEGHTDWVREVAWSTQIAHPQQTIVSGGLDGQVFIWRTDNVDTKIWRRRLLYKCDRVVNNVSWAPNGSVLLIALDNGRNFLYQERTQNEWVQISDPAIDAMNVK